MSLQDESNLTARYFRLGQGHLDIKLDFMTSWTCFSRIALVLLVLGPLAVFPITCRVGYGQRGRKYEEGIEWSRVCPNTRYCFEVIGMEMEVFQRLFDFQFDSYYNEYYARGCGGEWGSPIDYHPYRGKPDYFRTEVGHVMMNITTPESIAVPGGTESLIVKYICRRDLCYENAATRSAGMNAGLLIALVGVLSMYLLT